MNDRLSSFKRPLAGWIWNNTRHMDFETVFCPFAGWPAIPMMFKEQGKSVVIADLLESHVHVSRALVVNQDEVLDPFDVDMLVEENKGKVQLVEGVCNAYGMAPAHGAWLDNMRSNASKLDSALKKSLALTVGMLVIRYLMSFDDETRDVMPDDDPAGAFHYYVEFMNQKVISNGAPCEAYNKDALELVASVNSDAMCFYLPSASGYRDLRPEQRMMELFVNDCTESELDAKLEGRASGLGSAMHDKMDYEKKLAAFFDAAAHIPFWILGYNEKGLLPVKDLHTLLGGFRKNVMVLENMVAESSESKYCEYLLIAHP